MMMDNTPAIVVNNVSFAYGATSVLSDVNLQIGTRDFACIVGPNGGGKTTLIKLLLGLLKPAKGTIEILGTPPDAARSKIGYVPQYFQFDMHFPIKVMDVVLMGRLHHHRIAGYYNRTDKVMAVQALKDVQLYDARDRMFSDLSGGQRQRVLIARALTSDPRLFILDEPMANVDPAGQNEVYELLKELNKRLTILMVTHDAAFVSTLVTEVVCVNRNVWVHPTSEMTGDTIREIYGGDVNMVRHDYRHVEKGHPWPHS